MSAADVRAAAHLIRAARELVPANTTISRTLAGALDLLEPKAPKTPQRSRSTVPDLAAAAADSSPAPGAAARPTPYPVELDDDATDVERVLALLRTGADDDGTYRHGIRHLENVAAMTRPRLHTALALLTAGVEARPPLVRPVPGPRGRQDFSLVPPEVPAERAQEAAGDDDGPTLGNHPGDPEPGPEVNGCAVLPS